jgi:hypothetical protein
MNGGEVSICLASEVRKSAVVAGWKKIILGLSLLFPDPGGAREKKRPSP